LCLLALVVLLGCAALAIDVGRAFYAKRALQAAADAAATAGALELPNALAAEAVAVEYSGSPGGKNSRSNLPDVRTSVTTKCLSIAPCAPVNAITVEQATEVDTIFAKVLGIDHFDVKARATACSPCGSRPADIMLVLDRTGSMCQDTNGNPDPGCTDLENAREALRAFVGYMDPSIHWIGFGVFPPATSTGSRCATPQTSSYNSSSAAYVLVPLSSDYKVNGELNESSNLVQTIACQRGGGATAYATALERAQAQLDASGRPDVQDVIVFFSDGAANTGPSYYPSSSPYRRQPCRQGVSSAAAIKSRGTIIYSVGYDLDAEGGGANQCRSGSPSGPPESPSITAYQALQAIASEPDTFFNQPNPGDLTTIYTKIAADVSGTRLVPDDLT
jgi:hypothetical protein